jgi:hypothetical protein
LNFSVTTEDKRISRFNQVRYNNEKSRDYTNPLLPTGDQQQSQNGSHHNEISLHGGNNGIGMTSSNSSMSLNGFMSQMGGSTHGGMHHGMHHGSSTNLNGMNIGMGMGMSNGHGSQNHMHQPFSQIQQGLIGVAPNLMQANPGNMSYLNSQSHQSLQMNAQQMGGSGMLFLATNRCYLINLMSKFSRISVVDI